MLLALILVPAVAGVLSFLIRSDRFRRAILVTAAAVHALVTASAWVREPAPMLSGWLLLDAPGLLFLSITSGLFLVASIYVMGFLSREARGPQTDTEEGDLFVDEPEVIFSGSLLLFLAAMTLVTISQHMGLLWVAIEATTLFSAPLIYFHRHHRSLEATWKYLILCSVGIGLALLGNFFLAVASHRGETPLVLADLVAAGPELEHAWLKAAFILVVVGYGTKMGLAPMHTWKPDAYSEAPGVIAGLLSGALSICAFLGILRMQQVCVAAGIAEFGQDILLGFGLLSMAIAAAFLIRQADFKRMLAYSSVEHMGILAVGIGLGGAATYGALLHAVNHAVTKGMLFMVASNIRSAYRTKLVSDVRGVLKVLPISGALWLAGFLAITGSPPFGTFLSEFSILRGAFDQHRDGVAIVYIALLATIFVGMAGPILKMALGTPSVPDHEASTPETITAVLPPVFLGLVALMLGLFVPGVLDRAIHEASLVLGGR